MALSFDIIFAGSYGTKKASVDADGVFKTTSGTNVHFRANEPSTCGVVLHLNTDSDDITIGDQIRIEHTGYSLFSGYIIGIEANYPGNTISFNCADPIVLLESAKIVHDDPVIEDNTDWNVDVVDNVTKSGSVYTTTISTGTAINNPFGDIQVLDDTSIKELGTHQEASATGYIEISDIDGTDKRARVPFIGKNSLCNKVAIYYKLHADHDGSQFTVEITEEDGTSVWSKTTVSHGSTTYLWETIDIDTRLEGGKWYYLEMYNTGTATSPNVNTAYWATTTNPLTHTAQASVDGGTTWTSYAETDGVQNIRCATNFEVEFECDWKPKYEGKHFTVSYGTTTTITWGGKEGYLPSYNNKTRMNTVDSDYDIVRLSYTTAHQTSKSLLEKVMNNHARDVFKYMTVDGGTPAGSKWNGYVIAQQSLYSVLRDLCSMDKITFRSQYHE